ncbi:MAG TPA: nitrogen fixation protein [Thiolapillus brandeum]|uniref:Nitrogen fixation protein n=1 Tax=Thiolapillus brandeum TaxID=1076588 RepID=A0A831JYA5_9GAMM|nr:nitrogen fixation protein [Thiolapillus brandeum]
MKIGVTSQNFRTITGHAGKTRRFLIYVVDEDGNFTETGRLDLPKEMSMHEFRGDSHPLQQLDILITGGCGEGFIRRMASWGIQVIPTAETDPEKAVDAVIQGGKLPPPVPHEH